MAADEVLGRFVNLACVAALILVLVWNTAVRVHTLEVAVVNRLSYESQSPTSKEQPVMTRLTLASLGIVGLLTGLWITVPLAQPASQPGRPRPEVTSPTWEYLRLETAIRDVPLSVNPGGKQRGHRACHATRVRWECQEFWLTDEAAALPSAMATLGAQGWELVTVVEEADSYPRGLTYLFKRPTLK